MGNELFSLTDLLLSISINNNIKFIQTKART